MNLSKPLLTALAAGALVLGGAGAWLALPAAGNASPNPQPAATGSPTATATAAVSPAGSSRSSCETEAWPPATDGVPAGDHPGGARGFYLYHDDSGWHLEVTHAAQDHVVFSGWVTTNGTMAFQRVDDERNDLVHEGARDHRMDFVFNNYGALDGVHFETHCADWLQFHLFINGAPAGVEEVSVGRLSLHPFEVPFVIDRGGIH